MVFEFGLVALFLAILVIVFLLALFLWGIKYAIVLAINSVIGFFALYAIKAYVWSTLVISIWSVGIVAVLGIFGFVIVLLLHGFGWAF